MQISKAKIEKMRDKISPELKERDGEFIEWYLRNLEEKNRIYDDEEISELELVERALSRIDYYVSRVYVEGKAKSTIITIKKCLDLIKSEFKMSFNYNYNQRYVDLIKDCITYMEIGLNLDISFYSSLIYLYKTCDDNKKINLIEVYTKGRGMR